MSEESIGKQDPFAIVPVEVVRDDRLTGIQLRVLITVLSFRNRRTELTCPSRKVIADRCGYNKATISRATTDLVELGWLEKRGSGGKGPVHYDFRIPEYVDGCRDQAPVTDPGTGDRSGHPTGDRSDHPTGDRSGHPTGDRSGHTEQTTQQRREQTKKQTKGAQDARFDEWWSVYPRKVAKKKCRDKWKQKKLDRIADDLIADVRRRAAEDRKWLNGYIPNPETYINQERWEDEIEPEQHKPAAKEVQEWDIAD